MMLIQFRFRAISFVALFLVVVFVYWWRDLQQETITRNPDDVGPIRFKISNIWAWNDDIVIEPAVQLRHLNVARDNLVISKNATAKKQPLEYAYNGGREFDVEGLEDYILWFGAQSEIPKYNRNTRCKIPRKNIFFLKTHFTGSDVITNILNRYGDLNNLIFALPDQLRATFNWPSRFQWNFIDTNLLGGALPSVLDNHARYNRGIIKKIMRPDTAFITILREPVSVFESTFLNMEFMRDFELLDETDPVGVFMKNPSQMVMNVLKNKQFRASLNLVKNPMFFDLGLNTADYHLMEVVRQVIEELDRQFHLVLIYEYLHESLVLFRRRMCWQMDDVLFLQVHLTRDKLVSRPLSSNQTQAVKQWNKADVELYEYFNDTLWQLISEEGPDFDREVEEFKQKLREVETDCSRTIENGTVILNPRVQNVNRYFCKKMLMNETEYLSYLRLKQRTTASAKKKR